MITDNTLITNSKIYKTVGEYKNAPKPYVIRYVGIMEKSSVRDYLDGYFFEKYLNENKMTGNLTNRIKFISNKLFYREVIKRCFDNNDLFINNIKTENNILNEDVNLLINILHNISSSNAGILLDYMIRRIICEIQKNDFYDSRTSVINSEIWTEVNKLNMPLCPKLCLLKTKNTAKYKTYEIMAELFVVSLSHSISFFSCCNQEIFDLFIKELSDIEKNKKLYDELYLLCKNLVQDKTKILLNPGLGGNFENSIPADCDIVFDDCLIDIKCTKSGNEIYEILQLLGYSALLYYNPRYNININKIGILNILQGKYTEYDISNYSDENLKNYLKLLNNNLEFCK